MVNIILLVLCLSAISFSLVAAQTQAQWKTKEEGKIDPCESHGACACAFAKAVFTLKKELVCLRRRLYHAHRVNVVCG